MKSLNDFKKNLQICKSNGITLKTSVLNSTGEVIRVNDFAPIGNIQSNSFAMIRNEKLSWVEFGKASQWNFTEGIKQNLIGGSMVFEFSPNQINP